MSWIIDSEVEKMMRSGSSWSSSMESTGNASRRRMNA
jgi:hypothetical protein